MKKAAALFLQFLTACIGIIIIGALPSLFVATNTGEGHFHLLVETIGKIIYSLFHFDQMTFFIRGEEYKVYPFIIDGAFYSLTLIFSALFLAYITSVFLTIGTMQCPKWLRDKIKMVIYFFESLPDILVVLLLQLFVIILFKKTDVLLMKVVTVGDSRAYGLPIICLAILPAIQLFRITLHLYEEELGKDYVLLGRAKGLKHTFILIIHILRNTMISLFFRMKETIWFMLSSLVVVELLFGIFGITYYLTTYMIPEVFTFLLLFIFVPIFLFYHLVKWLLEKTIKGGETI
ncbi:ABC transporter permease subunit [uncultured Metabacillus sp.]|uniref:ABC transporter permease subunit n=1 Tax=uncultured Metabacillus sp. TaxID=2860135 RepID=UPI00261F61D0|nr:ABC transporter permease subunit [uncultured Metabacillus sp.]